MTNKLEKITEICKEKKYRIIKEITDTRDRVKIHIENEEGYKGVICIGKFIRRNQDVCFFSCKNPYMIENIKLWLHYNQPNLELISETYENANKYLKVKCIHHGEYLSTWGNLSQGYGCMKCAEAKRGDINRESIEQVKLTILKLGFIPLFEEYRNREDKLKFMDINTGYLYSASYATIKGSKNPLPFSDKNLYTIYNIKLWLSQNGYEHFELLSEEYVSAHTNLKLYCKEHKEVFYATWNNLSKGKGCMKCGLVKRGYNPNLTDEERERRRDLPQYRDWRKAVYEKDDYTCQCCGKKSGVLHAHHLNGWNWCLEERFNINNGVTLCKEHHREFHSIYGSGNNTKDQFEEWLQNKLNEKDVGV